MDYSNRTNIGFLNNLSLSSAESSAPSTPSSSLLQLGNIDFQFKQSDYSFTCLNNVNSSSILNSGFSATHSTSSSNLNLNNHNLHHTHNPHHHHQHHDYISSTYDSNEFDASDFIFDSNESKCISFSRTLNNKPEIILSLLSLSFSFFFF